MSTMVEGSQDECVDAVNGGLHICMPVEGIMKMARRPPACVVPTELAWRPTWEVVANRLCCRGDLRGLAAGGPTQRRPFRRKEVF